MPNGHGGVMRDYSSGPLLLLLAGLVAHHVRTGWQVSLVVAYAVVVLLAERFALHRCLWHALEYGGACVSEQEVADAHLRYRFFAVVYAVVGTALVSLLWLRQH